MGKCASIPKENKSSKNTQIKYVEIKKEQQKEATQNTRSKDEEITFDTTMKEEKEAKEEEEEEKKGISNINSPLINHLMDLTKRIETNTENVEDEINTHFNELVIALNQQKNKLIKNINISKATLVDNINCKIDTINDNTMDKLNYGQYTKDNIVPLSKSYQFTSHLKPSSVNNYFEIKENQINNILTSVYLYQPEQYTKVDETDKYFVKLKWSIIPSKWSNKRIIITNKDATNTVIKYRKAYDTTWDECKWDRIDNSHHQFECSLTNLFIYDRTYEFQIVYVTQTPFEMTVLSSIRSINISKPKPVTLVKSKRKRANNPLAPVLKERVELFISIKDIVKKDVLSKSDPFVVVYMRSSISDTFERIGQTEVIYDTHYPTFSKQFRLDYYFEEEQILRFDVYDEDKKGSSKLADHDCLGSCTMKLGEIVHEEGMIMAKKLIHRGRPLKNRKTKKFTHLIATVEKVNEAENRLVTIQISCEGLPRMDGAFGKADPYFLVQRVREDDKKIDEATKITVYGNRSKHLKKTLNPTFPEFKIETQTLCNNDEYRPIIIALYDWDKIGDDDLIGTVQTSLHELKTCPKGLSLIKMKHNKEKKRGELNVLSYKSQQLSSFLDYMEGAVDLSLMVAVDFTKSNGDPKEKNTLHYLNGDKPSKYQSAIREIGNILSSYDTDQKYPVWGFGATFDDVLVGDKQRWNGTKHDFNLNLNIDNPEVHGIHGIEEAYLSAIKNNIFSFSGPTLFQPILEKVHKICSIAHKNMMEDKDNNKIQYFILLFITDGVITDMKQTKNEIVSIANEYLPLSIIIIGLGDSDFSMMVELDGDENCLKNSKQEYSKRDIVQFVSMNAFQSLSELSKETLLEVPSQFLSYVRKHDISPKKKIVPKMEIIENKFVMNKDDDDDEKNKDNDQLSSEPLIASTIWDNAPLPIGWERGYDENNKIYYIDNINQKTSWKHPSQS